MGLAGMGDGYGNNEEIFGVDGMGDGNGLTSGNDVQGRELTKISLSLIGMI